MMERIKSPPREPNGRATVGRRRSNWVRSVSMRGGTPAGAQVVQVASGPLTNMRRGEGALSIAGKFQVWDGDRTILPYPVPHTIGQYRLLNYCFYSSGNVIKRNLTDRSLAKSLRRKWFNRRLSTARLPEIRERGLEIVRNLEISHVVEP
jgi:hypothetical protein